MKLLAKDTTMTEKLGMHPEEATFRTGNFYQFKQIIIIIR